MAVTIAQVGKVGVGSVRGAGRVNYIDITGDAAYATGGYAITLAQLTGRAGVLIGDVVSFDAETSPAGYTCALDRVNSKVLFFTAGAQVANAANIATQTVRVCVEHSVANL